MGVVTGIVISNAMGVVRCVVVGVVTSVFMAVVRKFVILVVDGVITGVVLVVVRVVCSNFFREGFKKKKGKFPLRGGGGSDRQIFN